LKIRECCEGDELALLILRVDQSEKVDDNPLKAEARPVEISADVALKVKLFVEAITLFVAMWDAI
jgi:hypothetical protein